MIPRLLILGLATVLRLAYALDLPAGAPSTPPDALVSTDGTCGSGVTCAGSAFGRCCSSHGYCGSTDAHCGRGCDPTYGECGAAADGSSTQAASPPSSGGGGVIQSTSVVVSTRWTTATATETATVTPEVETVTRTATSVYLVLTTSTSLVLQTSTVVLTQTSTTTATSVRLQTSTSLRVQTSTSVSVRTSVSVTIVFETVVTQVTSTAIETSTRSVVETSTRRITQTVTSQMLRTDRVTVTHTAIATAAACGGSIAGPQRTTGRPEGPASPTMPGTVSKCQRYLQLHSGDTCERVAERYNVTEQQLRNWNPALDRQSQFDCDNLPGGYYLCVEA